MTRMEGAREEWVVDPKTDPLWQAATGKIVDPSEGPQEGVKLPTWPRSPDCRDVNCHKCPGEAWDLERDQAVDCKCDCHPHAWDGLATAMMDYGKAVVDSIVDAANNPPPSRAERRHPKPDQCDPSKGYHSTPHVGCILR